MTVTAVVPLAETTYSLKGRVVLNFWRLRQYPTG
jgi:hypothetical protein